MLRMHFLTAVIWHCHKIHKISDAHMRTLHVPEDPKVWCAVIWYHSEMDTAKLSSYFVSHGCNWGPIKIYPLHLILSCCEKASILSLSIALTPIKIVKCWHTKYWPRVYHHTKNREIIESHIWWSMKTLKS